MTERERMEEACVVREVMVTGKLGLHARPAAKLAQEAQKFAAAISLHCEGQSVDAKSILDILTLAAGQGSGLEIRAEGDDAEAAAERLALLFERELKEHGA